MATSNGERRERRAQDVRGATEQPQADISEQGVSAGSLATTALVLGGIALVQPELIAGMAIGAGVTLLSDHISSMGAILRPALKAAVKAVYTAAEVVAQVTEEIQDLVAEARAEHQPPVSEGEPPLTH